MAKRKDHIDFLRFIAVISVILFHFQLDFFQGGFAGVDVFFVISGFLISKQIIKKQSSSTFSYASFYKRRFLRLYPSLLFTVFLTYTLSIFILSPTFFKNLSYSTISSYFVYSNFYFLLQADYFNLTNHLKPLLHTWSLSIEEQFYFLWPILTAIYIRYKKFNVIIFITTLSFLLNILYVFEFSFLDQIPYLKNLSKSSQVFYLLPFRIYELGIGAIAAIYEDKFPKKHSNLYSFVSILIIITYMFMDIKDVYIPGIYCLPLCLATAVFILSADSNKIIAKLYTKPIKYIAVSSYSLYLIHWPIIVLANHIYKEFSLVKISLAMLLITLFSHINHKYIENFFNKNDYNKKLNYLVFASILIVSLSVYDPIGLFRYKDKEKIKQYTDFHKDFYGGKGFKDHTPSKGQFPDIYIIGDSHAKHLFYGLQKYFNGEISIYSTSTSCIHLKDFSRSSLEYDWDKLCAESYSRFLSNLKMNPKERKLVIFSHSWKTQLKLARFKGQQAKFHDIISSLNLFKEDNKNIEVIVLGQIHGTNKVDIIEYISKPYTQSNLDAVNYTRLNKDIDNFNSKFLESLNKNIEFIKPSDMLCTNSLCRNFDIEKKPIYSDHTGHLSIYGSLYIAEQLRDKIYQKLNWKYE